MGKYYDWGNTLSYNAPITIVTGARSIGKTFGFRVQMVGDALRGKGVFAEVCRYAAELESVEDGYFDKLQEQGFFSDYEFKCFKNRAFARKLGGEVNDADWELVGYFVALTQAQQMKKKTFVRPKNILFDEAFLDYHDRFHRYIPREYETFANLVSTLVRESPEDPALGTRVVLLGNSVGFLNPYFEHLGIDKVPKYGYQWYKGKSVLLHYVKESEERVSEKMSGTLTGLMLSGTDEARAVFANEFEQGNTEYIETKPKAAKFRYGIVYNGQRYGVWVHDLIMYVTSKIPKGEGRQVWAVTYSDNRIDYDACRKSTPAVKALVEWYYKGRVRYESAGVRERFAELLRVYGIR